MKHLIPLLFLFIAPLPAMRAQEVYNLVLANATRIVNSPTSGFAQAQIAQFKRTALVYLKRKAFEQCDTVPSTFLDTQAYYLSEFVTLYFNEIVKSKKLSDAKRKERIVLFMDASASNPLFKDPDQETTMAFVLDSDSLTPFCLNTNWEKAYSAAKENL